MKLISDHKFTKGWETHQTSTLSQQMCTTTHPPQYSPPLITDLLSSPSGISLFSWWKRLLGSCTNELALLLNDVCKLWPSLLPVNGAETQNPHRQLEAHSKVGAVSYGGEFGFRMQYWSLRNSSAAHWRYLVAQRWTSLILIRENCCLWRTARTHATVYEGHTWFSSSAINKTNSYL